MNYCSNCGGPVKFTIPADDDRPRFVCDACRIIHYQNPRMVVGCITNWNDKILLCRRAIEPRYGLWTVPAGFLENGETVLEGALRESVEEAFAQLIGPTPYALFNLSFISQVHFLFRASLAGPDFAPGRESLEVKLFSEEDVPWPEIAFSVVREALRLYFKDRAVGAFRFHMGDILPSGEVHSLMSV